MKRYIILTLLLLALISFGCAKKPAPPEPAPPQIEAKVEPPAPAPEPAPAAPPPPTARELYERNYAMLPSTHTVVRGECLWWIAEYRQIYNDPFMWPLIYKANRDQIRNPDLIYPGQVFQIPREFQMNALKENRRMAGAPRPYLPPQSANLPADIRAELGWSF